MTLHNRNKFPVIYALLLLVMAEAGISCKKIEPQKFSADSFLYFTNGGGSPGSVSMATIYKPVVTFSFLIPMFQMDTVECNKQINLPLTVQFDGRVADHQRKIKIELGGDGKEYGILPDEDSMYIPANGVEYKLNLKIKRPAIADTSIKTLTVTLRNTDDFSPEEHVWHTVTYRFGNWFDKASTYGNVEQFYGAFSPAKMFAMQEAVSREDPNMWKQAPYSIETLNTFLETRARQKPINFDPFTYNDLYNFLDYPLTYLQYYEYGGGPATNAYNAIVAKIVELTKALVVEKREAGKPILDESGFEISFP